MTSALRPNRRAICAAGAALLVPAATRIAHGQDLGLAPMRCADFLATLGVNTHVTYADSQYRDVSSIVDALRFIGIMRVRDIALKPGGEAQYNALAASGVSFCLFWGAKRPMDGAINQIAALESAHPGAIDALEGPNEINPKFAYDGQTGNAAGQRFMSAMRAAASANPVLKRKPLVSLSSYAAVAVDCDFANSHVYPHAGVQPAAPLARARERCVGPDGAMPGKPMMYTEFGYHTLVTRPPRPGAWQGVDPQTQAALIVNGLLDNAAAGVGRTYVYQLLDAYPDRGAKPDQEKHFGLFTLDGAPKPAAKALQALTRWLADRGPGAREFSPTRMALRVSAGDPVKTLALQDSSGVRYLALWNESPIWDPGVAASVTVTPISASVTLPTTARIHALDLASPEQPRDLGTTASATIPVGSHPVVVRIA